MAKQKRYHFSVTGRRSFPFDMLRYDCCWPRTGDDAAAIDGEEMRTIQLTGVSPPTGGRWNSFMWRVENIQEYTVD